MRSMMSEGGTDRSKAEILGLLAEKGETDDEIGGMLEAMSRMMVRVAHAARDAVDVCGTGGDGARTFNVSTAASFVAAAAGARVAKHGNRSSSGGTGSADIFGMLGCDLMAGPERAAALLERHRICFMFARRYHPAARHAAGARRLLAKRSVFNLLGPLCNPAGVKRQLVGVPPHMLERIPRILERRGAECVMSVASADGLDELSAASSNSAVMHRNGTRTRLRIAPEDLGIPRADLRDMRAGNPREALAAFAGAVSGAANRAVVHTTAMNAGGALVVAGRADTVGEGFRTCMETIESGAALKTLEGFVRDAGDASSLPDGAR